MPSWRRYGTGSPTRRVRTTRDTAPPLVSWRTPLTGAAHCMGATTCIEAHPTASQSPPTALDGPEPGPGGREANTTPHSRYLPTTSCICTLEDVRIAYDDVH